MKRWSMILLCISFLLVALSGCGAKVAESDVVSQEEGSTASVADNSIYLTLYLLDENIEAEQGTENMPSESDLEGDMTTTMVTSIDKDALSVETIVAEYNQLVIESIYAKTVVINDVQEKDNKAWVDFDSASVKALEIEPGSEGMLFYNLARSIDENMGDIDEIYFTMDGNQDFQLGHLWFEADRPFYTGTLPSENEDGAGSIGPE